MYVDIVKRQQRQSRQFRAQSKHKADIPGLTVIVIQIKNKIVTRNQNKCRGIELSHILRAKDKPYSEAYSCPRMHFIPKDSTTPTRS